MLFHHIGSPCFVKVIAQVVTLLVAIPSETTDVFLGRNLDILSWVSQKGSLVSEAAASRVTEGLSDVVEAVDVLGLIDSTGDGGDMPANPLLSRVMEIVGFLGESLARGMSVPEERAIYITSPAIQVRCRRRRRPLDHELLRCTGRGTFVDASVST